MAVVFVVAVLLAALAGGGDEGESAAERERGERRSEVRAVRQDNLLLVCGLDEDTGYLRETGEQGYYGPEGDFPQADIYTFEPDDNSLPTLTIAVTWDVEAVAFANCGY